MTLRQQQPVVTGVLDQPSARFSPAPCCKLVSDHFPIGAGSASRPPLQIPEVIDDQSQPQPHLVGAKAVTGKPRHRDHLLALFDLLLVVLRLL
jgi:hypothetical protein